MLDNCVVEPELMNAKAYDSFQFVRNGFFCADCKDSKEGQPVFKQNCFFKELIQASGS